MVAVRRLEIRDPSTIAFRLIPSNRRCLAGPPRQHSLERQLGVMPDPKFGPVMIIGGDEAAWGGSLRQLKV